MTIFGLTGGIGSGKSAVANEFRALGIDVLDADAVARNVVEPNSEVLLKISEHFGDSILNTDGSLNRSKLRGIIFSSNIEKQWLEQLLHPLIRNNIAQHLAKKLLPYQILESPLLLETDQANLVKKVILVDVDEATQAKRASQRDGLPLGEIERIIHAQMPRSEKLKKADFVIDNSGTKADLKIKVLQLHQTLQNIASQAESNDPT